MESVPAPKMKILIVGAGIGGLTLAAFLEGSNIEYEIVEKVSDWTHQGYSLSIWNNGRNILKKLGLADIFDACGKRIQMYYIYDGKGKLLRKYSLKHFYSDYGMALTLTSRKDLHDWLMGKVDASKITMNVSVNGITKSGGKMNVDFTNGRSKQYDLVVGADGIHSKVRDLVFKEYIVHSSKWRVWYMWVDNKYRSEAAVTEYIEPGEFISLFDSGENTLAIIVAEHHNVLWDDPHGRIERLKKSFVDETALVPQMFESLKDVDINPADLLRVHLKTWTKDEVVLLGDAAHGFGPYAGIGGSMALEDGYVLAGELMRVSDTYSLPTALKNYEEQRRKRTGIARRLSAKMRVWAVIKSKVLRKLVNLVVPFVPERVLVNDYYALLKEEI
ncbi:MAG: FAD-dependent monooxygenase [Patescibacteria group bacterium]